MALSVYRLNTQVECEEPANEIQVTYHATDVNTVCSGGGTSMSIFSDSTGTLNGITSGGGSGSGSGAGTDMTGGVTNPCNQGMDVVFVLDYSHSGHYAYWPILKQQYTTYIGNKINTLSGGDYRVGIVTYEGDTLLSSPAYSSAGFYQNLPAGQKISENVPGGTHFITCWQKMTQANNTTVSAVLNALDNSNSNSTAVDGSGDMQPAGRALLEVGTNEFAGQWRNGVAKFIIVLSSDDADETVSYMQNTVLPGAEQNQIQHIALQKNNTGSSPSLAYICGATTPEGSFIGNLNLGGNNWAQVDLPNELTNDCSETTIYDCSPIAAGWYQEVGDTTAYYYDGTNWTTSNDCNYQVTINLVNSGSNVSLDNIASDHTYYGDADTYFIDMPYGTQFTLTNTVSADSGYTFSDIDATSVITVAGSGGTISVVTDSTDNSLLVTAYQISGTVTADMTFNVLITASANQNPQTASIVVVSDVADPFDANGQNQTPSGGITIVKHTPSVNWSDVSESYAGKSSLSHTFSETPGTTCSWRVNLNPNPSDYTLNNISSTASYSSNTIRTAVNGTTTTNSYITGSFTMPSTSGHQIRYNIGGGSDQPDYTYSLTAQISSGGGSISGAPYSQTYTGYTGDQFNFSISIVGSTDVQIMQILSATESDSNISNVTINNVDFTITGTVTMPSGGGSGDVDIVTRTQGVNHTFSVIIQDPFTDNASYPGHQFTGQTGSSHSQTISLQNTDSNTTYTVTGVSDNSIPLTSSNSGTDIVLSLGSMPSGGGSATVTVTGSNVAKQYNYIVEFKRGSFTGSNPSWANTDAQSVYVTITGTAGSTQLASYDLVAPINGFFNAATVSENELALSNARRTYDTSLSYNNSSPNIANIQVEVAMPAGGGSGRVDVTGIIEDVAYTHQWNIYTNSSSTVVNNISTSLVNSNNGVGVCAYSIATTSTNGGGYSITFTGTASSSAENFHAAVQSSNTTDYEAEIGTFSNTSPSGTVLITGTHVIYVENTYMKEGIAFSFFMPGKDPRNTTQYADITNLEITTSLIAQTLSFTLNYASNMSGVTPIKSSDTFTGNVGTAHNYSVRYQGDSSVSSFNVTGATSSGSASITKYISSPDVSGSVIMPSGGGSSTLTASGTVVENCGCDFMSTPPLVSSSNPTFSGGSNGQLSWTLTDTCGGAVTLIEYKINSGNWINASGWWSSSSVGAYSKNGLSAATYSFRFSFGSTSACQYLGAVTLTNPSSGGSGSGSGSGSGGGKELSPIGGPGPEGGEGIE